MSRAYKVIDGTLDNVGERIVEDYGESLSCSSMVGRNCADELKNKLEDNTFKSLGFDENTLTIPLPEITTGNDNDIAKLVDELRDLSIFTGKDFTKGKYLMDTALIEYVNKNKDKLKLAKYDERAELTREINDGIWIGGNYKHVYILLLDSTEARESFFTNTPNGFLFGLKPSKFLSRYVEPMIPGITERYALLLSEKHTIKPYLTIDPNIMINCSESGTFSSCFEHGGEFHYSAQRFANAEASMMAVVFNEDGYILYRNWVMVNKERTALIELPRYTSIRGNGLELEVKGAVREFVMGTKDVADRGTDFDLSCHNDSYLDEYHCVAVANDTLWSGRSSFTYLGEAYAVEDGYSTCGASPYGTHCQCCDERDYQNEMTYVSDVGDVCEYCIGEYYRYVESEGEWYYYEDVTMNVHGEYFLCYNISDDHTYCDSDGEWYPDDECIEAYDTDKLAHKDDLYYSEELDRYYECEDTMIDAEEEAREEEEV